MNICIPIEYTNNFVVGDCVLDEYDKSLDEFLSDLSLDKIMFNTSCYNCRVRKVKCIKVPNKMRCLGCSRINKDCLYDIKNVSYNKCKVVKDQT